MPLACVRAKLVHMSDSMVQRALGAVMGCGVLALALLAASPPVRAQGISIGWQDCRSGGNAGFDRQSFGCTSNTTQFPLYPSVRLAAPVDSVFSVELVIDVDVAADPLPEWWLMDAGSCRALSWTASAPFPGGCSDAWGGAGSSAAVVQGWLPGVPGGSSRHARLLVAAGVLAQDAVALAADVSYTLCRVALDSRNTAACTSGCTTPACLVFNSVLIRRLPGSAFEEVLVTTPEVAGANVVVWQPLLGSADCASVPVRRSTWGAVKALYR